MKKFLIRWVVLGLGIIGIVVLFFIFKKDDNGKLVRYSKKTGEVIK